MLSTQLIKLNYPVIGNTTVSLETYPLYSRLKFVFFIEATLTDANDFKFSKLKKYKLAIRLNSMKN